MAFTLEDGTGLASANALVSVADANAFHADRGNTAWAALATEVKERAIIKATDYLRDEAMWRWRGTRKTALQRLSWPRTGVTLRGGLAYPSTAVPADVADATAFLALAVSQGTDLQPVLARGGRITSEKVDVISVSYAADAPAQDVWPFVAGGLRPYLRDHVNDDEPVPHLGQAGVPEPFAHDAFTTASGAYVAPQTDLP